MFLMRREVDPIARFHLDHTVFNPKASSALNEQHELVLILIVSVSFGRDVTVGNNSLDADAVTLRQYLDEFSR
jgi:hypothetical protein